MMDLTNEEDLDWIATAREVWQDDDGVEEAAEKLAKLGVQSISKEWTGPHEGERGGTYWLSTETGERRYQEEKPDPGEEGETGGGDGAPADAPADSDEEEQEAELVEVEDGKYAEVEEIDPFLNDTHPEDGDSLLLHDGTEIQAAGGVFLGPDGEHYVMVEHGGSEISITLDNVQGMADTVYDAEGFDVDSVWGAKLANGINTEQLGESGTDGFVGVRDIQHHASDIENPELLAEALKAEKEGRNSSSATGALESRIRALGEDPDAMLDELGYGDKGGGEEWELEDSPEEVLNEMPQKDPVWESKGIHGGLGTGLKHSEEWKALAESADTEEILGWLEKELEDNDRFVAGEVQRTRLAIMEGDGEIPGAVRNEFRRYDDLHMAMSLLYYREDAHVGVEDIYRVRKDDEDLDVTEEEVFGAIEDTMDSLDPVWGAATAVHTNNVLIEQPSGDSSWSGQYRSTTNNIATTNAGTTVAHELGHSLHYMMGLDGGGSWNQNSWGDPKDVNVSNSLLQELAMDTGVAMDTDWGAEDITDDMIEDYAEAEGYDEEALRMQRDLWEEWEHYRRNQLDITEYDTTSLNAVNERDLNQSEYWEMSEPSGGEALYTYEGTETLDHTGEEKTYFVMEPVDNRNSVTRQIAADDLPDTEVREAENVKVPDNDASQIRSYQAKGIHEFFTVTFENYVDNRAKLDRYHEAMGEFYDEYFGTQKWETADAEEVLYAISAADTDDAERLESHLGFGVGDRIQWTETDGYAQNFVIEDIIPQASGGVYFEGDDGHKHYLTRDEVDEIEVLQQ